MSTALLEIEQLTKSFGGVHAVRDCTFAVPEGQVVGLIGPNGAGKSTVVDLVSGFGRPDSGSISFAGEQLVGKSPDRHLAAWPHPDVPDAEGMAEPERH